MKWLYFVTTLLLIAVSRAEYSDGEQSTSSDISPSLESKTHQKRELFGHIGKYSPGYDVAHVKHSYIKPFLVQYPVQSIPIGIKVPFKNLHKHKIHIQKPVHLPKPAWPSNNCNHGQGSHPIPRPLPPPATPLVPTQSGDVPVLIRPTLVPPVFDPQPFVPVPAPTIPIAPLPVARPVVPVPLNPVVPVAPVAPLIPLKPLLPAPVVPSVIKHGHSTHSFTFATFPKHHYVNALPALAPAHVVPAPAPLVPAPVPAHFLPAPIAPLAPVAHIPSFLHKIPVHQYPIPAAPLQIPIGRFPLGHVPLGIGRIPLGVAPNRQLFNQIPVNFGVGPSPHPSQTPVGFSPFPQQIPVDQNPALGPQGFGGHPQVFEGQPQNFGGQHQIPGQVPFSEPGFPNQPAQNPFSSQGPAQFPSNSFIPDGAGGSLNPGFQEQDNGFGNVIPNNPPANNVWTPMSNPGLDQFPTFQNPQHEQFPTQINPDGDNSQIHPQGAGQDQGNGNEQGYVYRQNGNQAFRDGQDIQQNLQQQAEQQFLLAQQYFNQHGQPSQEQQQQQDISANSQFQQQNQEVDENAQQFSQQQFISGAQLPSGDPQHEPQLPQVLPDHHLSGKPISQAFVSINHRRRRLRKRPHQNQEE